MLNIKPSAAIRNDYNSIANLCKETGEPVYLTKNGEGELVVMDIAAFAKRESELKLYGELMAIGNARKNGTMKYYTIEELDQKLTQTISEAKNNDL